MDTFKTTHLLSFYQVFTFEPHLFHEFNNIFTTFKLIDTKALTKTAIKPILIQNAILYFDPIFLTQTIAIKEYLLQRESQQFLRSSSEFQLIQYSLYNLHMFEESSDLKPHPKINTTRIRLTLKLFYAAFSKTLPSGRRKTFNQSNFSILLSSAFLIMVFHFYS